MTKNNEENIQPERIKKIKEEALNLVKEVNKATLKKNLFLEILITSLLLL